MTVLTTWYARQPAFYRHLLHLMGQHLLILLAALVIFLLDRYERVPAAVVGWLLMAVALGKGGYFLLHSFKALSSIRQSDHPFQRFLVLVSLNLVIILLSYALDYFCLYKIYPGAFRGYVPGSDAQVFGQFLYLSVTALACAVVGDISPVSGQARVLLSAEVITGFVTTIFVISNFSNHLTAQRG